MPIWWVAGPATYNWVAFGVGLWILFVYYVGVDPAIVAQANNPYNF